MFIHGHLHLFNTNNNAGKSFVNPDYFDDEIADQPQQNCNYDVADAVRFGDHLGGLVHPFLVLLQFVCIVLYLVEVDENLFVDIVESLADVDCIVVHKLDPV